MPALRRFMRHLEVALLIPELRATMANDDDVKVRGPAPVSGQTLVLTTPHCDTHTSLRSPYS